MTRSNLGQVKTSDFAARKTRAATIRESALSKELAALDSDQIETETRLPAEKTSSQPSEGRYNLRLRDSSHKVLGPVRVTKPPISGKVKSKKKQYDGPGYQGKSKDRISTTGKECSICAETQSP